MLRDNIGRMSTVDPTTDTLLIEDLLAGYRSGSFSPADIIETVMARADRAPERHVWITRLTREVVMSHVRALERRSL